MSKHQSKAQSYFNTEQKKPVPLGIRRDNFVKDVLKQNEERDSYKEYKSTEKRGTWILKSSEEKMRLADPTEQIKKHLQSSNIYREARNQVFHKPSSHKPLNLSLNQIDL